MRISISGKGIHRREVAGVEKLRGLPKSWYAFTNLELIQPGSMPHQIDVVIVLDDRILIVDLKDWHGRITSDGEHWLQNDRVVDTSPVKKILDNARTMAALLSGYLSKEAARNDRRFNRWELPLIEGCVVLTGRCDTSKLPDSEKSRVFPIEEFCRFIQDSGERNRRLAKPNWIDKADPMLWDFSKADPRYASEEARIEASRTSSSACPRTQSTIRSNGTRHRVFTPVRQQHQTLTLRKKLVHIVAGTR